MEFSELITRARLIREKYTKLERKKEGKEWSKEQLMQGFIGDVEDLKNILTAPNIDKNNLGHELSDCLWSIIILADKYGINLEMSFEKTMTELEKRLDE